MGWPGLYHRLPGVEHTATDSCSHHGLLSSFGCPREVAYILLLPLSNRSYTEPGRKKKTPWDQVTVPGSHHDARPDKHGDDANEVQWRLSPHVGAGPPVLLTSFTEGTKS